MKGFRACVQRSGRTYYYLEAGRKKIPLGSDYTIAVKKWVALTEDPAEVVTTFKELADKYVREVMPTKAKSTQATQKGDMKMLLEFFCDPTPAPLDEIKPKHIHALLRWKSATPTTANRLKRLFSHMFNVARAWGYTENQNPVTGIRGHTLDRRSNDVTDDVYEAVWQCASVPLRDAMDLAYLTGQRPGDVLRLTERDIVDGVLVVKQSKTAKPLRVRVEGEFGELIKRIFARKAVALSN